MFANFRFKILPLHLVAICITAKRKTFCKYFCILSSSFELQDKGGKQVAVIITFNPVNESVMTCIYILLVNKVFRSSLLLQRFRSTQEHHIKKCR